MNTNLRIIRGRRASQREGYAPLALPKSFKKARHHGTAEFPVYKRGHQTENCCTRSITLRTEDECQRPARTVRTPRSLTTFAIETMPVVPED